MLAALSSPHLLAALSEPPPLVALDEVPKVPQQEPEVAAAIGAAGSRAGLAEEEAEVESGLAVVDPNIGVTDWGDPGDLDVKVSFFRAHRSSIGPA